MRPWRQGPESPDRCRKLREDLLEFADISLFHPQSAFVLPFCTRRNALDELSLSHTGRIDEPAKLPALWWVSFCPGVSKLEDGPQCSDTHRRNRETVRDQISKFEATTG